MRGVGVPGSLVAVALLTAMAAGVASGQEAWRQSGEFVEEVEVRLVEVDVRVVDKKGRPVTGLTADDFLLFEDGRPVEIAYFSVVGEPGESPGTPVLEEGPSAPESTAPAARQPRRRHPFIALYLDQVGLMPADRGRILDDLERFVSSLDGQAYVSLLTSDGGLTVEVQPTLEAQRVLEGLERARGRMAKGFLRIGEEDRAISHINELYRSCPGGSGADDASTCGECWRDLAAVWREYAGEQTAVAQSTINRLLEAVKTVAPVRGRKEIVYVSSGLTRLPGIALNEYVVSLCPYEELEIRRETPGYDLSSDLHDVSALANASRVTIHSLDAGGIRPLDDATVRAESALFRYSRRASELKVANLQSGLFTVAEDTGGRAIFNANQPYRELVETIEEIETGYVLGFHPTGRKGWRTHLIDVKLRKSKKGMRISHRGSYVDRDEDELLVGRLLAALQLGWGGNPLGVEVRVGASKTLAEDIVEAPIWITTPPPAQAEGEERAGSMLTVLAVAMDSEGRRTIVRRQDVRPVAESEELPTFVVRIKLPPESYRFAIGIESAETGRTSYVVVESDLRVRE